MNLQTRKKNLMGFTAEQVAKILDCHELNLEYYAWPQTFGSTSGPFRGIGGQAMSTFTIEAWADASTAFIFCNGRKVKIVDNFQPGNVRLY